MKLAIAIIFALIGSMAIADQVGKVCPNGASDVGSYWDGKTCTACPADCPECNWNGKAMSCIKCTANKFLKVDGDTGSCVKCADNCKTCRGPNAGDCIIPNDGYKLTTGGALFKCASTIKGCQFCNADEKCGKCEFGYLFNSTDNTCKDCPENCAECSSTSVCTKCQYWYSVNNGTCAKCDTGCNECPCKTCKAGYAAATDKGVTTCTACAEFLCSDCSGNKDVCKACPKSSQLKDGKCLPCAETGCSDCSADKDKCTACFSPKVLKDGKCVDCPANCDKCSGDGTCDTCKTGFYKSTDKKTCTACPAGCKDNKCTDGDGTCSTCADGYILKEDKKSCESCGLGCKSCKNTTATGCETCFDTYVNVKGTCKTTPGKCKVGEAAAADDNCYASTIDNCVYGLNSSAITCLTCAKSYYNDGKSCTPCPVGCDDCSKYGDYVKCSNTGVPQEYFSVSKSNGKKDLTGYLLGGVLTAKVNYDGKATECMPNNLLTFPIADASNTQCNTHETCTYPVKLADMRWTCKIEGKNAVKVAVSVFAMAVAAIFAL